MLPKYPKKKRFKIEWVDKPVKKKVTLWGRFIIWFKKSFWER
tara:strand:- start:1260 stop:1385 length:126 start_codon:yes stop_codon:yes gene_type:complete